MIKKIDQLTALMDAGEWHAAIKFAAKFPRLGKQKRAITTAAAALLSPHLYNSMGKDPEQLIAEGAAALRERYGNRAAPGQPAPVSSAPASFSGK